MSSSTRLTCCTVSGRTRGWLLSTRETVATETPAILAISATDMNTPQGLGAVLPPPAADPSPTCKRLQVKNRNFVLPIVQLSLPHFPRGGCAVGITDRIVEIAP